MEQFTLSVEARDQIGSSRSNSLRRKGMLPGIIYGHNEDTTPVSLVKNDFIKLAQKASSSQLFTLKSQSSKLNGRIAVIKGIQKNYLNHADPIHVDFLVLKDDKELTIDVPLRTVGEPVGVKISGGVLSVAMHKIAVSCLPKNIPGRLEVDVSAIDLGQSLTAEAIQLPNGVRLAGDPKETIASVVAIRIVEEAAPAAAATAEGAAAPVDGAAAPAEGAATPEGGAAPAAPAKDAKAGGKEK